MISQDRLEINIFTCTFIIAFLSTARWCQSIDFLKEATWEEVNDMLQEWYFF